jgi:sec-independent protein translocase protein TatC
MDYFLEFRRRLIWYCAIYFVLFVAFFYWQNSLLTWLLQPLTAVLKSGDFLIASQIASPVLAPLHVASELAFYSSLPFGCIQFWYFIKPALHFKEQIKIRWGGAVSFFLGLCGILFCFYGVLPWMFELFAKMTPAAVRYFPEVSSAARFVLRMLTLFALAFQLPLLMLCLACSTDITYEKLKVFRPYVIVIAFVLGMLLTPPDVLSQIFLAVPLCLLYELGLWMVFWRERI